MSRKKRATGDCSYCDLEDVAGGFERSDEFMCDVCAQLGTHPNLSQKYEPLKLGDLSRAVRLLLKEKTP